MHSTQAPSSKKKYVSFDDEFSQPIYRLFANNFFLRAKLNSRVFNQQTDRWLYKSPSTTLFKDFCNDLIQRYELDNCIIKGKGKFAFLILNYLIILYSSTNRPRFWLKLQIASVLRCIDHVRGQLHLQSRDQGKESDNDYGTNSVQCA